MLGCIIGDALYRNSFYLLHDSLVLDCMVQVFVYKFSNMSAWWQGRKGLQDWAWWERGAVWGPVRCGRSAPKSQKGSSAIVHHTQASIAFDQLLLISILGAVSCCSALLMGYWQVYHAAAFPRTCSFLEAGIRFSTRLCVEVRICARMF